MGIEFRDQKVQLNEAKMILVPRGEEHKPFADEKCKMLMVKPKDVLNTGDAEGELIAKNEVWGNYQRSVLRPILQQNTNRGIMLIKRLLLSSILASLMAISAIAQDSRKQANLWLHCQPCSLKGRL